jgi:hypothetical protein
MAGEIPPLDITINLQTSGVTAGVEKTTASLKNVTAAVEGSTQKFTGLKTVMLGTFASNAIQKGLHELETFLKDTVHAAEEAEVSTTKLATALNNAKQNTDANREAIMKSTDAMRDLGFNANDTRNAFTKMVTATGSVTESQRLMGVTADYARLKHMDLASAASTLTRGTTGAMRAFREYGIVLDTTIPKNQAITKAFDELNQKIGGQAAAYAQTYAGKLAILGAQSEDLKEKIGALLLPVLTKLASWFVSSMQWLSAHKAAMEAIAVVVGAVLTVVVTNLTQKLYAQAAAWVAANLPMIAIVATIGLVVAGFIKLWNASETFRKVVVDAVKFVVQALGYLIGAIGQVVEAATHLPFIGSHFKGMSTAINGAALEVGKFAKGLDGLADKKISIKFPNIADELAKAGGSATAGSLGIAGRASGTSAASKASDAAQKALDKQSADLKKALEKNAGLYKDYDAILLDRQTSIDKALGDKRTTELDAHTKFDQAKADIDQKYQDSVDAAETARSDARERALTSHNENIIKIEQAAADKRRSIIQSSIDAMTSTWQSATKLDLAAIFAAGGDSAEGLVTGLQDQLKQVLQLQTDAGKLAAAGYSQSFIDQVIAKGPDVGDKMAQAVLNSTPETAAQIKNLYGQIDTVSQSGMDQIATTMNDGMHFANLSLAKEYAQVGVDLQASLLDESTRYRDALTVAQQTYDKAMASAADARDLATKKAQDALTNSLTAAQQAYDKMISDISTSTDKKLTALQIKINDTLTQIQKLGGSNPMLASSSTGMTYATGASGQTTALTPAGTGITFNQNNIINGNAAPAQIGASALDMVKYGTPQIIAASAGTPTQGYVKM